MNISKLSAGQKGFAPILIIILIALGVGGYLLYQKQIKPVSVSQPVVQASPVPQYTVTTDQQTKLETYTNKKMRFSVQYPINYQDSAGDNFLTLVDEKIFKTMDGCAKRSNLKIEMYIEQTKETSAKDMALGREKGGGMNITKQFPITVGGMPAYITEWNLNKCVDGSIIDVVRNGYRISINKYPLNGKEDEFNQILSTFKFTQ